MEVMRLIEKSKWPLFIAHQKPDGDTLGSVTALINYALEEQKTFSAFCLDQPGDMYLYLPGIERVKSDMAEVLAAPIDLLVVLDAGDLVYAGVAELVERFRERGPKVINLDHHATNEYFGDYNVVLTDAASTTEVIARLLQSVGYGVSRRIATCLLTGILTDTGVFANPATSASAIAEAGWLLSHGASFNTIIEKLTRNKSLDALKLWGRALGRLKYNSRYEIASVVVRQEDWGDCEDGEEAVEGLANFLNSLAGVKATLVIKELSMNKIKGSFRTTCQGIDVSAIAGMLGGGGHKKAAGFTIDGELKEVDGYWQLKF